MAWGRKNDKPFEEETDPKKAGKQAGKSGNKDAWCTTCEEWYDTSNEKELNKHAH